MFQVTQKELDKAIFTVIIEVARDLPQLLERSFYHEKNPQNPTPPTRSPYLPREESPRPSAHVCPKRRYSPVKSRVTLFCNGEKAISCDLDGLDRDHIDDVAENLLVCCVSHAIDGLDEDQSMQFVEALQGFDFGLKIERITDEGMSPYQYHDGVFDRVIDAVKRLFKGGD